VDSTGSRKHPMAHFCKHKEGALGSKKKGEAILKNGVRTNFDTVRSNAIKLEL